MNSNAEMERLQVQTAENQRSRFYGKYRGIAVHVDDPKKLARIKVKVPEVYGQIESPWALPVVPFAGPNHGLVLIPEEGDGVWVEFEAGDISRPLWVGGYWGNDELPAPGAAQVRVLATKSGHQLIMDDDGKKVQLLHSGGAELTMTDDSITIKIGSSQIVLSSSGVSVNNGALEVQ